MSKSFLVSLIDISPRSLFFCLIVSPLFQVFEVNSPFLTHLYGSFLETFGSRFIIVTQSPFIPLVGGSLHFECKCKIDVFGGHYFNCLSKELGFNSPYHSFQVFIQFLPLFVRGNWCEYLKAIPFLNTFEISATTSPPPGLHHVSPLLNNWPREV